ncbi:hypothetical protein TNCV_4701431 [Trichonephila clavipes]|nr:hypothetical protein TNCV_4701431 [Trichonephila clavipes]
MVARIVCAAADVQQNSGEFERVCQLTVLRKRPASLIMLKTLDIFYDTFTYHLPKHMSKDTLDPPYHSRVPDLIRRHFRDFRLVI